MYAICVLGWPRATPGINSFNGLGRDFYRACRAADGFQAYRFQNVSLFWSCTTHIFMVPMPVAILAHLRVGRVFGGVGKV